MKLLNLQIPEYSKENDPTKSITDGDKLLIDWTIPDSSVKIMRKLYEGKCCRQSKKRGHKTSIERKGDLLDFEQAKKRKPKEEEEEEKCENDVYTSQTHQISKPTVAHSLECKTDVKDRQEGNTNSTDYEIKTENDT